MVSSLTAILLHPHQHSTDARIRLLFKLQSAMAVGIAILAGVRSHHALIGCLRSVSVEFEEKLLSRVG